VDGEPFSPAEARKRIRQIAQSGKVEFSAHAYREMLADVVNEHDVYRILRTGVVEPPEWENGAWRYRVRVLPIYVVCEFIAELEILVVTAWRRKRP
jgi:hypothetical protein